MRLDAMPLRLREQVRAALAQQGTVRRASTPAGRVPRTPGLPLRCASCGYGPTRNLAAMERHCDEMGHHRYDAVL